MDPKKSHIINSFWIMFDNIIKLIGGFFVGVWMANHLGKEFYGVLSYSLVFHRMFFLFVDLGFVHILVQKLIQDPKLSDKLIGTVKYIKAIGAVLAFIISNITAYYFVKDSNTRILIFILTFHYFGMIYDVYNSVFTSKVNDKYRIISHSISFALSSIAKVILILIEAPLYYFALSYLIDFFISAALKSYFYRTISSQKKLLFDLEIGKMMIHSSWAIAVTLFLNKVITQIDRLMIGNMLSDSDLGIYSVSTDLIYPLAFSSTIISSSFIAYLMNLKKNNEDLYRIRINQIFNIITWLGIITSLILAIFSKLIFSILYSEEYLYAYIPFSVGVWEFLFTIQLAFINLWLINENKQNFQLYISFVAAITNIIGNFVLIKNYGMIGAAISTAIVRASTIWLFPLFFKDVREISLISFKALNIFKLKSSISAFTLKE